MNDASYVVLQLQALSYAQTSPSVGIPLDGSVPFSVDAWVSLDGLCAQASILAKDGVFSFGLAGDALALQIAGYPAVYSNPATQPLTEVDWHHVCATYANGQVRLYIDGAFNVLQGIAGSGQSSASSFLVGEDLQAEVSCVRVFNQALSADAVQALMFHDPDPTTVVAWLDFSQAPPVDRGSGHLPISLQAGAEMLELTPSLALGGTAYAEPHSDAHVNPGGGQVDPYTVQAWVHVEGVDPPEQAIFVNGHLDEGSGMALLLEWDATAKRFRPLSQRGAASGGDGLASTATFARGRWANVATTFDGTTLTLYVDGVAAGSMASGPIAVGRLFGTPMIGAAPAQGQSIATTALQGFVSRLEVWTRALSAAEVAQYMATAPPVESAQLEGSYDFTTAPARNAHDRDPVGLVDGAALATEISAAGAGNPLPTTAAPLDEPGPEPLDDATLERLLGELDFAAFLRDHEQDLRAAAAADEAAFAGDASAQQRIHDAWEDALARARSDPRSLPFLVTWHELGDERVLLCHTRRGTHVAMRTRTGDIDACTEWKIALIFCAVGGLLDALFGISARLGQRAIDVIVRVLRNPRVMALTARGAAMTAGGIFTLLTTLWSIGFLRELLSLVAELSFWTLLRIVAKLLLKLVPGLGAADVIASLAATVISFVYIYTQRRPSTCDPLPTVDVAAIKFNWDPSGTATDALAIRRNYGKHVPVAEWTKGETRPEQSPAAYAIAATTGKTLTIQAKLVISDPTVAQAQLRAEGGGVLGAIDPVTVRFKNGTSDPDFVTLPLNHQTLAAGGVGRSDIAWTWFYDTGGGWKQLAVTQHRIYALLAVPTGPWRQSTTPDSDTQVPWTDVLDLACVWAQGTRTGAAAAAAVTQQVNGRLGLSYEKRDGAGVYTTMTLAGETFLCTEFLAYLAGRTGKGAVVNCTDCASIVTTFANALGCNVCASLMFSSTGGAFTLNEMIGIGSSGWGYPFTDPPQEFTYHEVAWTGTNSYGDPLYDACLQVDAGSDPWNWTDPRVVHTAQLPLGMTFSTLGPAVTTPVPVPFTAASYRERMTTNNSAGIGRCQPQGVKPNTNSGRRSVI
ncbi:MAG TPA: LamG-like jellyroll fold domain-containing protein [Conexibacter sp.]|jgi:hypothetical protein|nr:LamG-like jellyroll fold domain-containing protein [Conexibacter sp.]